MDGVSSGLFDLQMQVLFLGTGWPQRGTHVKAPGTQKIKVMINALV